jgi:capsular polysaccharide transport system ATP-binding protein
MIIFENVHKSYRTKFGRHNVIDHLNLVLNTDKNIGILGLNGAGKSTLIRLISGVELPDRGHIRRRVNVSFPLGFVGCFSGNMSGRENAAFVARVYGFKVRQVIDFVEDLADLGKFFDEPFKTYSSGMGSRLGFAVSLALDFEVYLIDEGTAAGDARFAARFEAAFKDRVLNHRIIMVSHSIQTIRDFCQTGAVLHNGRLTCYDDVEEAIQIYDRIASGPSKVLQQAGAS